MTPTPTVGEVRAVRIGPQLADVLADAQKLGYAEADPSEDIDGADAAAKLAIIAAVGLRRPVRVADIATRSIRPIEPVDFEYARELGCTIRQIARASAEDNGTVFAAVHHAEVIAQRIGEPYGTLLLTLAAVIDVVCWRIDPFETFDVLYLLGLALPVAGLRLVLPAWPSPAPKVQWRFHQKLLITATQKAPTAAGMW